MTFANAARSRTLSVRRRLVPATHEGVTTVAKDTETSRAEPSSSAMVAPVRRRYPHQSASRPLSRRIHRFTRSHGESCCRRSRPDR